MAQTVDTAFNKFLSDTINLDPELTRKARASRNWLFAQIKSLQNDASFPKSYEDYDMPYGSFARRTKKRPLDDIDMIVGLHAQGSNYDDTGIEGLRITVGAESNLIPFCFEGTHILNSNRILNKFKKHLAEVPQYSASDIKRDGSAVVISLSSYEWSFDVVPAFLTATNEFGRNYYLIPDGNGYWKKADPRIDGAHATRTNQAHNGMVLNVIRIMKYWNKRPTMPSMGSYALEAMILDYYDNQNPATTSSYIDIEIPKVLYHISRTVLGSIQDPKGIQGDINNLEWDDKIKVSGRAEADYAKAIEARRLENDEGDQRASISKWREVFGDNFPSYG